MSVSLGLSTVTQAVISALLLIGMLVLYLRRFTRSPRWLLLALAVCLIDQLAKALIVPQVAGRHPVSLLFGAVQIVYLQNREQGFGGTLSYLLVLTVICVLAMYFLYDRLAKTSYRMSVLAECGLALMVGGYLGILLDRVTLGFVVDFIEFGRAGTFVYNIADLAVIFAVALLALRALKFLSEPRDWHKRLLEKAAP